MFTQDESPKKVDWRWLHCNSLVGLRIKLTRVGPAVIISPLLSLVNDQIRAAETFDLVARKWNGSMTEAEKNKVFNELKSNAVDLLFLTPEMIVHGNFATFVGAFKPDFKPVASLKWVTVPLVVFDERP